MADFTVAGQRTDAVWLSDGQSIQYVVSGTFTGTVALGTGLSLLGGASTTVETRNAAGTYTYQHKGLRAPYWVTCISVGAEETITVTTSIIAAESPRVSDLLTEADLDAGNYPTNFYRDHIVSLSGINPVGPATAPTADPDGEGWLFAGVSTDNVAVLSTQINHDCQQGSVTIKPHLHWRKTTDAAGDVKWKLEYKTAEVGGDFGAYAEVGTVTTPIAATVDNDTAARHLISSFGDLTITVGLSTIVVFKLTRVASDTVNDTYAANALAMSFDFHYPTDTPGSWSEYSKTA